MSTTISQIEKGSQNLCREVIQAGFCTSCGACLKLCPSIVTYQGRVVHIDNCDLTEGRCSTFCPRTVPKYDEVSQASFGLPYKPSELGTMKGIYLARATSKKVKTKGQYGGVVSALSSLALTEGLIDGAVLTRSDSNLLPQGCVARNPDEVLEAAGSSYVASPTLAAFNEVCNSDLQNIGVVGTPCQVLALRKMMVSTLEKRNNIHKLKLVIGLFCTWALTYSDWARFLGQKVDFKKVRKIDIPPPPANVFVLYTDNERIDIPLEDIRQYIMPACAYCPDMTNEFADLAVGAAEGIEGWNTVIMRSELGRKLFKKASDKGLIETTKMPVASLEHLTWASQNKKKRAFDNMVKRNGSPEKLLFLSGFYE
jgi:coenzyme F420 hydrogenase subunit beta